VLPTLHPPSPAVSPKVGLPIFLANGCTAFALNIATVYLIKNTSALVLTLGGIIKDILLIAISTIVFPESHVTPTQMFGYSIALFGLQVGRVHGSVYGSVRVDAGVQVY
jgi:uncharacterized membrane protein YeiH